MRDIMTTPEWFILIGYVLLMLSLSAVALHRLGLCWLGRGVFGRPVPSPLEDDASAPAVLVQLPLYNERFVVHRLLDAVRRLDYPRDKLTVQVLDDSTDDTSAIVAELVSELQRDGIKIEHITRVDRVGFKAGALAHGLTLDASPLVTIFDADFIPQKDFLRRLVPHFEDSGVALVQARWAHENRASSPLTQAQAILLNGHFSNEHTARFASGFYFNFNGTAGIWRRAAIDDAGGWSGRTLTEDLDLSYRAQIRGWKFVFRPDVSVPAELPKDVNAFKAQQFRWAKGATETAKHLLGPVWGEARPLRHRLESTNHLLGNASYPLVILLVLWMPFALQLPQGPQEGTWLGYLLNAVFIMGSTGSLLAFYGLGDLRAGSRWANLAYLPLSLAIGVGLAVNNTRAVFEAMIGKRSPFVRTPKSGSDPHAPARYRVKIHWQVWIELLLGLYAIATIGIAIEHQRWVAVPFVFLFALGFSLLAFGSFRSAIATARMSSPRFQAPGPIRMGREPTLGQRRVIG